MSERRLSTRAKRMNRKARIQSAHVWLKKYNGKNIVYGYRKHFGLDWACAIKELEMLGVKLDPKYVKEILKSVENKILRGKPLSILLREELDALSSPPIKSGRYSRAVIKLRLCKAKRPGIMKV